MTECYECGDVIEDDDSPIVSGNGVWCSVDCWEDYHEQPWPNK